MGDGSVSDSEWESLRNNINGIITQLKNKNSNIKIVVCGYYDLFDGASKFLAGNPLFGHFAEMSNITVAGNDILSDVASKTSSSYINIYDSFFNHAYGSELGSPSALQPSYVITPITSFDIHPVTAGHQKIYEKVYEGLEKLK